MAGVVLGLMGLAFLGGALVAAVRRYRYLKGAVRTAGAVVRVVKREVEEEYAGVVVRHDHYVAFPALDGASVEFLCPLGADKQVGYRVVVRYTPQSAAVTAELAPSLVADIGYWTVLAAGGAFGVFLLATSVAWLKD